MELSVVLAPASDGGFVALNPKTGTATQGETIEKTLTNLREANELYINDFPLAVTGRSLSISFTSPRTQWDRSRKP